MAPHFVLFEHAAGYGLFKVKEFEEVATFLPQVEEAVMDVSKFQQVVSLIGFFPFKHAADALNNINAVSEGVCSEDLKLFLETNMPKAGKKAAILGVLDSKLSAAINEATEIKCSHIGVIPEIVRGIRMHFPKLVKGFTPGSSDKAQLGLSHSYSRAKVKFNVNKSDNMIIQSIALLDQLDKDINTFSMRIREWYSFHFPELIKIIPENALFAKCVKEIKNRKDLTDDKLEVLESIVMDSGKAQAIIDASKSSMGMDISPVDLINIDMFAARVIALTNYRKELSEYLRNKMHIVAPNLGALIGDTVGARLISHAGSLTNLAKCPASTVQILGAEKALFRALKTRGNTPKYGLIFHSSFIGRAGAKNKGRISRYLANKCSIASRIDCFSENATTIFGSKMKEQVEDRLKFYETGDLPRKNVDVMAEAMEEANDEAKKMKKKEKKKKRKLAEENGDDESMDVSQNSTLELSQTDEPSSKKKKKKHAAENGDAADTTAETSVLENGDGGKKKKKKNKDKNKENEQDEMEITVNTTADTSQLENGTPKKKKKKKSKDDEAEEVAPQTNGTSEKKKKKNKSE
ncbi:nucleolar protein 56 [Eurytemora carolleeae]|uniref:nucleolar protein 56 n=1 Tax=Eurytemora carolleeae TaxID=1294199 RepID=UPI000C763685|nr:nucleolar protein 56 [Eurytemora carolleeae]|eukprot:XP_023335282.1 nucleolar protein 56-like [Eurytemora affinis]